MLKTLIVLPDGRELFSGGPGAAVVSARLTRSVNRGSVLTLGSVCPAEFSCTLTEAAEVQIGEGDELVLWHVDDRARRHKVGIFIAESTVRKGISTVELTARDRLVLLEKDLTDWLSLRDLWPYSLRELAGMVCRECGLELDDRQFPNGDYPVQQFTAQGITGTQLMQWVGQIAGCFCRANADGVVELDWYTPTDRVVIAPTPPEPFWSWDESGHLTIRADTITVVRDFWGDVELESETASATFTEPGDLALDPGLPTTLFYYRGSLSRSTGAIAPVERVVLRRTAADAGVSWPKAALTDPNTYVLSGNFLFSAVEEPSTQAVAQSLYDQLSRVSYTPGRVEVPADPSLQPGQILRLTDSRGEGITLYIMTVSCDGSRMEAVCQGTARRDSPAAVSGTRFEGLSGKVMELRADVDGLQVQSSDTAGKLTELGIDVEGLHTRVSRQEETAQGVQQRLSTVEQTASSVDIAVKSIRQTGVEQIVTKSGYSFTDEGLVISKQGQQMHNLLDCTGMYVSRSGERILQANHLGVEATDVTVRNYLVMGVHSRFEDYGDGTACFYI